MLSEKRSRPPALPRTGRAVPIYLFSSTMSGPRFHTLTIAELFIFPSARIQQRKAPERLRAAQYGLVGPLHPSLPSPATHFTPLNNKRQERRAPPPLRA